MWDFLFSLGVYLDPQDRLQPDLNNSTAPLGIVKIQVSSSTDGTKLVLSYYLSAFLPNFLDMMYDKKCPS